VSILDRVLASSGLYEASRRLIGAQNEMRRLVDEVVHPQPGQRLLDFGCGNGRLVPYLRGTEYVGVDGNQSYIDAASAEYGSPTVHFICGDLLNLGSLAIKPVDTVASIGVLHHLDDNVAEAALRSALAMLRPGGRLITMDPCFEPSQASIARVLMALDRGRYVRHPADYRRLVERAGGSVTQMIWDDVYRFPYTHCVQVSG
jgi:SAM-dependent methyltransferase